MLQIDLEKLIPSIFRKEIEDNKNTTSLSQITTIIIKSLLPDERKLGNIIDYRRFKEELNLWKYYRTNDYGIFHRTIEDKNTWDYFSYRDDTLYARLLPIIVANSDYSMMEKEALKNLLFTTGDLKSLWNWIISLRIIYNMLNQKHEIIEDVKSHVINFSQIDFLENYEAYYRFSLKEYPGNFNIQFEREKINVLNILNNVGIKDYEEAKDLLNVLNGQDPKTSLGNIILYSQKNRDIDIPISQFYINLNDYLLKLRKSRIDPKDLKIAKYHLPDVFSFKEGDVFYHSLIKEGKVIKKEVRNNILTSLVQTRSGMYLFKRDPF